MRYSLKLRKLEVLSLANVGSLEWDESGNWEHVRLVSLSAGEGCELLCTDLCATCVNVQEVSVKHSWSFLSPAPNIAMQASRGLAQLSALYVYAPGVEFSPEAVSFVQDIEHLFIMVEGGSEVDQNVARKCVVTEILDEGGPLYPQYRIYRKGRFKKQEDGYGFVLARCPDERLLWTTWRNGCVSILGCEFGI